MQTVFSERKKAGTAYFAQVVDNAGELFVQRWEQDVIPVITAKFDEEDQILLIECFPGLDQIEKLEILERCPFKSLALRKAISTFDEFCLQIEANLPNEERSDDELLENYYELQQAAKAVAAVRAAQDFDDIPF